MPSSSTGYLVWLTANWVNVIGLVVSVLGFGLALWQIRKVKGAADAAAQAARETKDSFRRYDTAVELAACLAELDEAKRLNRANLVAALPERYAAARKRLIGVREATAAIAGDATTVLQTAITQLAALERDAEAALGSGAPPIDPARHNAVIAKQADRIVALSARARLGDTP